MLHHRTSKLNGKLRTVKKKKKKVSREYSKCLFILS